MVGVPREAHIAVDPGEVRAEPDHWEVELWLTNELRELKESIEALQRGQGELVRRLGDVASAEARAQRAETMIDIISSKLGERRWKRVAGTGTADSA